MKKHFNRLFIILCLISLTLGFRWNRKRWRIGPEDNTIWVKICDGATDSWTNNFPDQDSLAGDTLTFRVIIQSIVDDINNLSTSYLNIELYPEDGVTAAAGSTFTVAKALERTIDICPGDPNLGAATGVARPKFNGDYYTECKMTIKESAQSNAKEWMGVMAHELGHCLGLNHPQGKYHAVMSYFRNQDLFRYQIDDLMAFAQIYPSPNMKVEEDGNLGLKCAFK